jgi:aspartyl-tRNA(Asn)/glutamyl-tRNA(Gln) amidotransferase subunit A
MYLGNIYTVNKICWFPALSVPCGESQEGLPIGFQIIGLLWRETNI